MSIASRLLQVFVRGSEVGSKELLLPPNIERALDGVFDQFGRERFLGAVRGKDVVDFGSGLGYQCIALARDHGCRVVGVEIRPEVTAQASRNAVEHGLDRSTIRFVTSVSDDMSGHYDAVLSVNAMEHYIDPAAELRNMFRLLRPGGCLFLTFGPAWYAPYGAHMHFFCWLPWLHLIFPEAAVMNARRRFRDDGAQRYEEVGGGLNRMSLKKFSTLVADTKFAKEYERLGVVKGLNVLARVPGVRELMVNRVTAILRAT